MAAEEAKRKQEQSTSNTSKPQFCILHQLFPAFRLHFILSVHCIHFDVSLQSFFEKMMVFFIFSVLLSCSYAVHTAGVPTSVCGKKEKKKKKETRTSWLLAYFSGLAPYKSSFFSSDDIWGCKRGRCLWCLWR